MKKLLSLFTFLFTFVCLFAQTPSFQLGPIISLPGAGTIKKIDGNYTFTSVGVYDGSQPTSATAPPTIGGVVTNNGQGALAITTDAQVSLMGNSTWVSVPDIYNVKDAVAVDAESLLVFSSTGEINFGPNNTIVPNNAFNQVATNPITDIFGPTLYPFEMAVIAANGDAYLLHQGSCNNFVVLNRQSGIFSTRVVSTQYAHDDVVAVAASGNGINYVATTTLNGTSNMTVKFMNIDEFDSVQVLAEVSPGVNKMETYDSLWTVFSSSGTVSIIPQNGTPRDGIQQNGSTLVLYNKNTGVLESLMTLYHGGIADIQVTNGVIAVAINPSPSSTNGALIYCGADTLWLDQPTVLYLSPSTATAVTEGEETEFFKIANSGGPNPTIKAYASGVITVSNALGQEASKSYNVQDGSSIQLDEMPSGVYFATFLGENNTDYQVINFSKR